MQRKLGCFALVACLLSCLLAGLMPGMAIAQDQDEQSLADLLGNAATCALAGQLRADMPIEPAFSVQQNQCRQIDPRELDAGTPVFGDGDCRDPLAFESTSLQGWCNAAIDTVALGSGGGIGDVPRWGVSPGTAIDLGARSLEGVLQPWVQRRVYRTVQTSAGACPLEMRVYARSPTISNQRSLLALHGGSWSARGFGFFGLELTIPHFVEQGFVVYTPFYRLLGDTDAPPACHDSAIDDIVEDANAALDWVSENAALFGSAGKPVVFGQSAGGQLAASLVVNRPQDIAAAILFYAPVDFEDFVLRVRGGQYDNPQGVDILERLLGVSAQQADVSAAAVADNTLPRQIMANRSSIPPVFLLHGEADALVEARQSVRFCDALAGRMLSDSATDVQSITGLRVVESCGEDGRQSATSSRLHRVREGLHALDVCLAASPFATQACRSGSAASRAEVASAIGDAVSFAVAAAGGVDSTVDLPEGDNDEGPESAGAGDGQGGGGAGLWLAVFGLWSLRQRSLPSVT